MTIVKAASAEAIKEAAQILRDGGLVALPTETVYGLGANALDGQAVAKIFEAKNRPSFNPLIVHVADKHEAEKYAHFDDRARAVAAQYWPGPLTLVLPRNMESGISDLVSAGLPTIALRVPAHITARQLLKEAGIPIAAPSANASGQPSATTPQHVIDSLGDRVPFILADGACQVGLESTVLDLTGDLPAILRPGAISADDLEPLLGAVVYEHGESDAPKSPGLLLKHYAPSIPVRLRAVDVAPGEGLLAFGSTQFMGVRGGGFANDLPEESFRNLSDGGDLHEAAANLFAMLRALDNDANTGIAVMDIPAHGVGIAILDRLERAARGR